MTLSEPTILLTRPAPSADVFAAKLRQNGWAGAIVLSPAQQIIPIGEDIADMGAGSFIFTSRNAVRAAAGRIDPRGRPAYCVGPATTEAARAAGFAATQAGANAQELIGTLIALAPPGPILRLRGRLARGDIKNRLCEAGLDVRDAVIYDQRPLPLTDEAQALLDRSDPVILPLFSPKAAEIVSDQIGTAVASIGLCALSSAVNDAWRGPAPTLSEICARPDARAMLAAVNGIRKKFLLLEGRPGAS